LKQSQVRATFRKQSIRLFGYGSEKPLSIHGIFATDVVSIDTNEKCTTDFVAIQRDAITLLGEQSALSLGLLRVGPQASHVDHHYFPVQRFVRRCRLAQRLFCSFTY